MSASRRVAVLSLAIALDVGFGDLPTRMHPVGFLGRGIAAAEERLPRGGAVRDAGSGSSIAVGFPLAAAAAALAGGRLSRRMPFWAGCILEALLLKQCFAVRGLFAHTEAVRGPLAEADLQSARNAAAQIVSRETAALDLEDLASAAIESLSENASDSAVAPWFWYAVAGLPAAAAYRAANTLDAMVGYRKKGLFGTPSARLDDILNFVPARLTGAATAAASSRARETWAGAVADSGRTPSPNSGWPMAAAAHALGVRLEKKGHHVLNDAGRPPAAVDVRRAQWLVARTLVLCAGMACVLTMTPRRSRA